MHHFFTETPVTLSGSYGATQSLATTNLQPLRPPTKPLRPPTQTTATNNPQRLRRFGSKLGANQCLYIQILK